MANNTEVLSVLRSYEKLVGNADNHARLLKEKTILLYTASELENECKEIVSTALEIFRLLILNDCNHSKIISTFGVFEALETLAIKKRSTDPHLSNLASEIINVLRKSAPPAYSTRNRGRTEAKNPRSTKQKQKNVVFIFHVIGLHEDTRENLEEALVRIKGVISVVIDCEHQRCTVRVVPKLSARFIAQEIHNRCQMTARYVARNAYNQEVLRDLLNNGSLDEDTLPPYLPETDSPAKPKAIVSLENLKKNASDWIQSATSFFSSSFYW